MSTYKELTEYLNRLSELDKRYILSFTHIEEIVKRKLPPSARKDRTFWANTYQRYYARFWLQAGWKVQGVDFQKKEVIFIRQNREPPRPHVIKMNETRALSSSVVSVSRFVETSVPLNDQEFMQMKKVRKTADKAIEIVKKYLRSARGGNIDIHVSGPGADLRVVSQDGEELIEVKGTASANVSWSQLKVSSQQSYENLLKGIPLYRVVDVDSRTPRILILRYGKDFVMEPEPRWAVKPAIGSKTNLPTGNVGGT